MVLVLPEPRCPVTPQVSDHVSAIFQKLGISPGPGNKRVKAVLKWLRVDNPVRRA
jgi:hypothetical protein